MNKEIKKIFQEANGRYFTSQERELLLDYSRSLPSRLQFAQQVEKVEEKAVSDCIEEMKGLYPNFEDFHHQGWEKGFRDVQIVLRNCVVAMVKNDLDYLDEKTLFWLRTMLASNNFTPAFLRDCYTLLKESLKKRLSPPPYEALVPYLDRTIEVLSDIPEPQTPMV